MLPISETKNRSFRKMEIGFIFFNKFYKNFKVLS